MDVGRGLLGDCVGLGFEMLFGLGRVVGARVDGLFDTPFEILFGGLREIV